MSSRRRAWADIDLRALCDNLRLAKGRIPAHTAVLGVVKADAYGHGAVPVSRALADAGISMLGVGDAHEAIELREAGIETPILVLGATLEPEIPALIRHRVVPTIHSPDRIETFAAAARTARVRLPVHLLIDTGMSRLGVTPERAIEHLLAIANEPALELAGVGTHLASPDQEPFSREQITRFSRVLHGAIAAGVRPPIVHIASSLPLAHYPETCHDMVRLGGFLYGLRHVEPAGIDAPKPILSLRTEVAYLRDHAAGTAIGYGGTYVTQRASRLATLPVGFHDGFPHALSNCGEVLVRGQRAPVVGRVTMDYVCIDVTDIPGVATGETVTIIGDDGDETIQATDVARWAGTIPYEIPCRLGPRVERIPFGAPAPAAKISREVKRELDRWVSTPLPAPPRSASRAGRQNPGNHVKRDHAE